MVGNEEIVNLGLIGLGVMGRNLALNLADHGYRIAIFDPLDADSGAAPGGATPCTSLEQLVARVAKPRPILLMIKAGKPVDEQIEAVAPFLEPGDILIDGGNSHFRETIRRAKWLEERGLLFLGVGERLQLCRRSSRRHSQEAQ